MIYDTKYHMPSSLLLSIKPETKYTIRWPPC